MALFLSTYKNKVDKKGRVSVPAPFRAVLANQNFSGIVAYASFVNPCIEASGMDRIETLYEGMEETLDPFSEERDAFATAILGSSMQLGFDGEGRVMLPQELMKEANITEYAVFVGKGQTFEIWEPERFEGYAAKAREMAKANRDALRLRKANGGASS